MFEKYNLRLEIEIFGKKSFDFFIEGIYKSSKNENQKIIDEEEASSDYEDDADIPMIDEVFSQNDRVPSEDDAEISTSSTQST
jgi:hypothetical protein